MKTVEFETQWRGDSLEISSHIAAQLPPQGVVKVVLMLSDQDSAGASWRLGAYEQFMHEDDEADAVYDTYQ